MSSTCTCIFTHLHVHLYKDLHSYSPLQIQAIARMWKARTAYTDRLKFFKDHVSMFKCTVVLTTAGFFVQYATVLILYHLIPVHNTACELYSSTHSTQCILHCVYIVLIHCIVPLHIAT